MNGLQISQQPFPPGGTTKRRKVGVMCYLCCVLPEPMDTLDGPGCESMELGNDAKKKRTSTSPLRRTEVDSMVVIITPLDNKTFSNRRKVTEAIQTSDISKLFKPEETRVLRLGKGLMVNVCKENLAAFENLTKLGEYDVKTRVTRSQELNTSYGFIGPFEADVDPEKLKTDMKAMFSTSTIVEVIKVTNKVKLYMRVKFQGPLPINVSVGHLVYKIREYCWPVKRCGKCFMYGHGAITCRNAVRYSNCSGLHKQVNGATCKKEPYCYLCEGNHKIKYREFPKTLRAIEIRNNLNLSSGEQAEQLFKLNSKKKEAKITQPKIFKAQRRGTATQK